MPMGKVGWLYELSWSSGMGNFPFDSTLTGLILHFDASFSWLDKWANICALGLEILVISMSFVHISTPHVIIFRN